MDTIKIAVCDDEPYIRSYLISLIQKQNYKTEITEYASADAYLSDAAEYDLLFLDIELGESRTGHMALSAQSCQTTDLTPDVPSSGLCINGMELARRIRASSNMVQPLIIFVTGHERYVYDAFDVDAFQYLIKPIDEHRFAAI